MARKIAFTYGDFDCINQDHIRLLKEMRKIVIPDDSIIVVLVDDYANFENTRRFPIQDLEHRKNHLEYFCKDIRISYGGDPANLYLSLMEQAERDDARLVYVGYDDNKEFPGAYMLKKQHIPLRFIKKYVEKTTNN